MFKFNTRFECIIVKNGHQDWLKCLTVDIIDLGLPKWGKWVKIKSERCAQDVFLAMWSTDDLQHS